MSSIILRRVSASYRPLLPILNSTSRTSQKGNTYVARQLRPLNNGIVPIHSKQAMQPVGPYSQAIKTPHAIYCSGQLPADSQGNLVEGSTAEKTRACLEALDAILTEAGSGLDRIVKIQIFLTDMADFAEMNKEYEKLIKHKPARSCVAVKQLPKNVNIEIECVALPGNLGI